MNIFDTLRGKKQKPDESMSEDVSSVPNVSVVPNPIDDLDGYDRAFILSEDKFQNGSNRALNKGDLTPDVLQWARENFPGTYGERANQLSQIKLRYYREHPEALRTDENRTSWKQALGRRE